MNVKRLSDSAIIPCRGDSCAAGYDLFASSNCSIQPWTRELVKTDICLEIPGGLYGRIASRSSMALKNIDIGAGVIDSNYRGEIKVVLINNSGTSFNVNSGDKIAQIIFEQYFKFEMKETDILSQTSRGDKGFGSTN
jgi:dUTP pyrophosphatase